MTAINGDVSDDRRSIVSFCPMCFASDDGGSWGVGTIGDHCLNCGAGGAIHVPRWAVDEIRRSASWVGRRYYPQDEDREIDDERRALLATVTRFPGRHAEPARRYVDGEWEHDPERWQVCQLLRNGSEMSTIIQAESAEAALEASRFFLRYVPESK